MILSQKNTQNELFLVTFYTGMKFKNILFFFYILLCFKIEAQVYPNNYFKYPMDTPMYLSAPFGTLRDNHFHSGMDIRTNEKEGLPVYAIADGFVSRIKIQSIGYGNAIYISHPNGYTSVYGHLQKYNPEITAYVKSIQYQNESFEIDHFPVKNKLKITKGQIIGYSGNTGTSSGPHLHFEIRDSRTEQIINPQLFNIFGVDSLPPIISKIALFNLNDYSSKLISEYTLTSQNTIITDSGFIVKDTIQTIDGTIGIGIVANDYMVDLSKEYSIYGSQLYYDTKKIFAFQINRFAFDKTRCVNAHIDYANYKLTGIRYQKLFLDNGNNISLYPYQRNKGKISINDNNIHLVKLTASDFGNRTFTCYVYLKKSLVNSVTPKLYPLTSLLIPNKNNTCMYQNFQAFLPEQSLFDTTISNYKLIPRTKSDFSDVIKFLDYTIPLNKAITVSIKTDPIFTELSSKLCLYYQSTEIAKPYYCQSEFKDGYIVGKSSNLGIFGTTIDTIPPLIKLVKINSENFLNDTSSIQFIIEDNFSGIGTFKVTINKKWALFNYDAKNNLLTYYTDEKIIQGNNLIEVVVSDKKNNISSFKTTFVKQ